MLEVTPGDAGMIRHEGLRPPRGEMALVGERKKLYVSKLSGARSLLVRRGTESSQSSVGEDGNDLTIARREASRRRGGPD